MTKVYDWREIDWNKYGKCVLSFLNTQYAKQDVFISQLMKLVF